MASFLTRSSLYDDMISDAAKQPSSSTPQPHVFSANQELFQYLENYTAADNECPEFAVGIFGDWGIGKTFFIREWLKYRHLNHCYLSLFGISSIDSIEEAIFKTEHPILSSPAMKVSLEAVSVFSKNQIARKFPKLLVTLTDEVKKFSNNLQQQSEGDIHSSASLPLLVFDDVERTSLPYPLLFGYLSTLLQCRGYKIVLLYNWDKLDNICNKQLEALNEDNTFFQSFNDLLQKAVGIEFAFQGDFEDALQKIFAHHPELLPRNLEFYQSIVEKTGNNLRQVKQALWRFKYRWPSEIRLPQEQKRTIFTLYLAASCEFPLLHADDISPFMQRISIEHKRNFYDKYASIIPSDFACPLSPDLMTMLVCPDTPREYLFQQIEDFFLTEKKGIPAWRTLMDYNFITQEQFDKAVADIVSQLKSSQPQEVGELLHIAELADRLKNAQYITEEKLSELLSLTDSKLEHLFAENPENLAFLATAAPNFLTWGGYSFSSTEHVLALHQKYNNLLFEKRADRLTESLSATSVNFEDIRDTILQEELPLSQKLCDRNVNNFVQLLSQPDASAENARFAVFFMKAMQRQQLNAKAYFTNVLNQIQPPKNDRFALARYQLMKKTLTIALESL